MPEEPQQQPPGTLSAMRRKPDHGEESYQGSGRLEGKKVIITGGDSGIGRAVAIAFAREGADILISYLSEHDDARDTASWVQKAGRQAEVIAGDIATRAQCDAVINKAVESFGRIDVLVNNAAYQMTHETIEEISDEEWEYTFDVNITAMFRLVKKALPHMGEGGSIINTASVNADMPRPTLLPYATTKGAIANFTAGLAQMLGKRGIRANSVAPGPIWTPLIPSTMPPDHVEEFGKNTPLGRPGEPKEVAPAFVLLASDEASYISGAMIAVTGGKPIL
ncbi:glucose 1-dehydrogenase [Catelliglobosispora koreensis]|uniref:glucose 1-dehydrogenase n=1 Tax=Catelliglobosispora koreensis TaxID=129052 RepID=UPI00035CF720|nr:glucose 1-dehydrogenase [Catelliglobosispora koreensis]